MTSFRATNIRHTNSLNYIAVLLLCLAGCTTKPKPKYLFYPPKPDEPRLQFLVGFSSGSQLFGQSGLQKFVVDKSFKDKLVGKPYGIATRRNEIFYCDSGFSGLGIFDLQKRAMQHFIPDRDGKLKTPINADSDAQGNYYVTDTDREQVLIYGPDRSLVDVLGRKDEMKPCGIAVVGENLYVTDLKNHQVRIYRLKDRSLVRTIPRKDDSSTVSVNDFINLPSLATKLKQPERPVDIWLAGQLSEPAKAALTNYPGPNSDPTALQKALAQDLNTILARSSIYEEARFTNVILRSETKTLLSQNPQGDDLKRLNRLLLEDANPVELSRNQLFSPTNVAVDRHGRVYVSDPGAFCVQVYDAEGKHLRVIGRQGVGPGSFARPRGLAVDREDRLYVVDAATQVVQLFDSEGRLLIFFGDPTITGPGATSLPAGVFVDYDNVKYFEPFVAPGHQLEYVVLLTNQYGDPKISAYGFLKK